MVCAAKRQCRWHGGSANAIAGSIYAKYSKPKQRPRFALIKGGLR